MLFKVMCAAVLLSSGAGAYAQVACVPGQSRSTSFGLGEVGVGLNGRFHIRLERVTGDVSDSSFAITYRSNATEMNETFTFSNPTGRFSAFTARRTSLAVCPGQQVSVRCTFLNTTMRASCELNVL